MALDGIGLAGRAALRRLWSLNPFHLRAALTRAEADARLADTRLQVTLDTIPEGIVFFSPDRRLVSWNTRYAEIYVHAADLMRPGVTVMDMLRASAKRGDYPEAVGRVEEWLAGSFESVKGIEARAELQVPSGRWVMVEERSTADGGFIGLHVDITEMKAQSAKLEGALEEARGADRARADFLANISHEIRTPLNGVLGPADLLLESDLSDGQRDILNTLVSSAGSLHILLTDLLDFSNMQAGAIQIAAEPFDLTGVIEKSVKPFRSLARAKSIAISVDIAADIPARVVGDGPRLKQVLVNLIANSMKFTETGEVVIKARTAPDGEIVLEVIDTGIGFDQSRIEYLFNGFEKADTSLQRQYSGTGLGLPICRHLAELMGGSIHAVGAIGKGATFTMSLPLQAVEETVAAPAPAPVSAAESAPPLRILVVDDNATNRKVVDLMLTPLGIEVTACENGREAVDAFQRANFDLVLMDLQMPVMDGLTATATIRDIERAGHLTRTPLVVLSANFSPADRDATARVGADAHLGKPIQAAELVTTLMRVLEEAEGVEEEAEALKARLG